jgi:hypothetical protein
MKMEQRLLVAELKAFWLVKLYGLLESTATHPANSKPILFIFF